MKSDLQTLRDFAVSSKSQLQPIADYAQPAYQAIIDKIDELAAAAQPATGDGYPFPIPTWTPSQGDPALSDKDALDYLADMVLADQASSSGYVIEDARLTVLRTGRTITPVTGD